ncbi:superoxide dismutase family protein [Sphingomonas sp. HT-1]|jgi:Cu-Zn family superoxide dismutase|uniref:superoxide dismutase family protein n=1 Tax=unclassified Sphingomonas TaxID=196159 RepID=UPI0002DEE20C|nr:MULTISPECIES: superoxide dismutase family protein [unclassified Sphingomonas]KTF67952.1 superoxide dismutase [Sphingomonas sp. WG]
MTGRILAAGGLAMLALTGCVTKAQNERYMAGQHRAQAELRDAGGKIVGTAVAEEIDGSIRVLVDVRGVAPGPHGVHVHTVGKCTAPDFTSAGGHWNATAKQHGKENPMGPHSGDMPNLKVDEKGSGNGRFMLEGGTFAGLLDEDGASLVVHAGEDDYKTDPSGNSGGRIACGVFQAM